jgi:hypothetical protein
MNQVIKYDLQPLLNRIEMPAFSEVLDVLVQGVRPFLYVLGDPDRAKVVRRFVAVRTGQEVPDDPRVKYIGSFIYEGDEVLGAVHVFEKEGTC